MKKMTDEELILYWRGRFQSAYETAMAAKERYENGDKASADALMAYDEWTKYGTEANCLARCMVELDERAIFDG